MIRPKRLLALDIRASRFGFAAFEGPIRLLDWGVRSFGEQGEALRSAVSDRIGTLLTFYKPSAVVVSMRKYPSAAQNKRFLTIVASIKAETKRQATKFRIITTRHVRERFAVNGHVTKHVIATKLANQFEELSWRLPERRKSYQSEAPIMAVFGAVANAIAFFGTQTPSTPTVTPTRSW